jgi:hypothetical protein
MTQQRITGIEKAPQPEGRGQRRATSLKGPEEGGATLREGGDSPFVHVYDAALSGLSALRCNCRPGHCMGYWGACERRRQQADEGGTDGVARVFGAAGSDVADAGLVAPAMGGNIGLTIATRNQLAHHGLEVNAEVGQAARCAEDQGVGSNAQTLADHAELHSIGGRASNLPCGHGGFLQIAAIGAHSFAELSLRQALDSARAGKPCAESVRRGFAVLLLKAGSLSRPFTNGFVVEAGEPFTLKAAFCFVGAFGNQLLLAGAARADAFDDEVLSEFDPKASDAICMSGNAGDRLNGPAHFDMAVREVADVKRVGHGLCPRLFAVAMSNGVRLLRLGPRGQRIAEFFELGKPRLCDMVEAKFLNRGGLEARTDCETAHLGAAHFRQAGPQSFYVDLLMHAIILSVYG